MKVKTLRQLQEVVRLLSEAAHSEHLTDFARSRIERSHALLVAVIEGLDP